jgi:putative flippase GtrA
VDRLPTYWRKLLGYSLIGGGTFALDLLLYWYLKENGIHYLSAATIAFLLSVSLNYILSRSLVFHESSRHFGTGYLYFLLITGGGWVLTIALLQFFVEQEGFGFYVGRIIAGIIVGMFNYTVNYFFNFAIQKTGKRDSIEP